MLRGLSRVNGMFPFLYQCLSSRLYAFLNLFFALSGKSSMRRSTIYYTCFLASIRSGALSRQVAVFFQH